MEETIMGLIENGIISGLFVAIILGVVWKAFPYFARKFDEIEERHRIEMKESQALFQISYNDQRNTFERTMEKVVTTFNEQIAKSNDWHEKHSNKLTEITDQLKDLRK